MMMDTNEMGVLVIAMQDSRPLLMAMLERSLRMSRANEVELKTLAKIETNQNT